MEAQNIINSRQKHLKLIDNYSSCFRIGSANNIKRVKYTIEMCEEYLKINDYDDILINVNDSIQNYHNVLHSIKKCLINL